MGRTPVLVNPVVVPRGSTVPRHQYGSFTGFGFHAERMPSHSIMLAR